VRPDDPPPGRPWLPIARPTGSAPLDIVVLSARHAVVWSHWEGPTETHPSGREVRCLASLGRCVPCEEGRARRWTAWLAGQRGPSMALCLVPITAAARRRSALAQWEEGGPPWRGWRLRLARLTGRSNGPVGIVQADAPAPWQRLRDEPDLLGLLASLFPAKIGPIAPPSAAGGAG
jgi:hypothetical protein